MIFCVRSPAAQGLCDSHRLFNIIKVSQTRLTKMGL